MDIQEVDIDLLRRRILRAAPVIAYPRRPLIDFLRARVGRSTSAPRLIVLNLLESGQEGGQMCRVSIDGDKQGRSFVAPMSQLSFRCHGLAQSNSASKSKCPAKAAYRRLSGT